MADRVYFNLHRELWSVRGADCRVRAHWQAVCILEPTFKVSEAGRQRMIRERKKNVHSFACGVAHLGVELVEEGIQRGGVRVTYNPYRAGYFYVATGVDAGREVKGADIAWLGSDRTVYVIGPVYGARWAFTHPTEEN